jgi:hypothetical protein
MIVPKDRTYIVSTYDVADDPSKDGDWTVVESDLPFSHLRRCLERLLNQSYDTVSIAVECNQKEGRDAGRDHG